MTPQSKLAAEMADALRQSARALEAIEHQTGPMLDWPIIEDGHEFNCIGYKALARREASLAREALAKYDSAQLAPEIPPIGEILSALQPFGFWAYPHKFQGTDGECEEVIIPHEDVQRVRAILGKSRVQSAPERGGDEEDLVTRNPAPHAAVPSGPSGKFRTYDTSPLPAPPDPDGWIEWKGGECPVGSGARVEVKLRNGQILSVYSSDQSDEWDWPQSRRPLDIIAYRPPQPHRDR